MYIHVHAFTVQQKQEFKKLTTAKNRRNASIWTEFLKKQPGNKAHKFTLMEMVEMSSRSFEQFKAWYLWKMGPNMKYQNDEFHYLPDLEEKKE